MNRTFLKYLSAAACLAAASSSVAAQSAGTTEVRVIREQDPTDYPRVEKRLVEVIEMLDSDEMTEAQQKKAKAVLLELVERLQHDETARVVRRRVIGFPGEVEGMEVIEVEDDEMPVDSVRARVLRLHDDDGAAAGDAPEADHTVRGHVLRFAPRAPKAPKPPRAPKAPKAPEAPEAPEAHERLRLLLGHGESAGGEAHGWGHGESAGGEAHGWGHGQSGGKAQAIEKRVAILRRAAEERRAHAEARSVDGELRLRVERAHKDAAKNRAVARMRVVEVEDDGPDQPAQSSKEGAVLRGLLQEKRLSGRLGTTNGGIRPDVARLIEVESLDDVTEEHELRAMLDEMRAEMREVRALMQQIRERAPARNESPPAEPAVETPMRLMRQ